MELYGKSLRIKRGIAGKSHPYASFTLKCIANLLRKQGDLEKAPVDVPRIIGFLLPVGEGGTSTCRFTCTNIANILHNQGKAEESKVYFDKTLVVYLKVYGPNHPKVAKVQEEMRKRLPRNIS